MTWSEFFRALATSCLACESASRRVWSACWVALAARCSAEAARCSASGPRFWGGGRAAALGHQLLGGGLRGGVPFGVLPVGLLAAGGQLDLELGLGLGALRLAL